MKTAILAAVLALSAGAATAQQMAAYDGYTGCPADQTRDGLSVVEQACGRLSAPRMTGASFDSLAELEAARAEREAFSAEVDAYGACVTEFINSFRRPGAPADSLAPDQAACAHAWAEAQVTEVVLDYGRACVDFSNRSMTDREIEPWSGSCYPSEGSGQG